MASSSCAMELRVAGPAGGFLQAKGANRGASSLCHLASGNVTLRRIRRCASAALTVAQAAGLASSASPVVSSPMQQPALEAAAGVCVDKMVAKERARREAVTPERLDKLMWESIGEIVRNTGDAPFLMHIFSEGGRSGLRLEKEAALPERWPRIKTRWDEESGTPEAVILVEELEGGENEEESPGAATATGVVARGGHRTWGLVVQGRGMECAACYILNTTRVSSCMGFCTHFFLTRAKCFGEPVDVQLRNAALVR